MPAALRERGSAILVAALASAFGVALLQGTSILSTVIDGESVGQSPTTRIMVGLVAVVFFAIAVYVSAVVTSNTVSTVVAGRIRELALYRLIGADGASLRAGIARDGLLAGTIGAVLGGLAAVGLVFAGVAGAVAAGALPDHHYVLLEPLLILPVIVTILMGWAASWAGSRRVLAVTPIQALGVDSADAGERGAGPARTTWGWVLLAVGVLLLAAGVAAGAVSGAAVLIGVLGGILSFSGIVALSPSLMPALLRLTGGLLGSGPAGRIAAANAVRYPARSARSMIGLVIGITLISMFSVASQTLVAAVGVLGEANPGVAPALDEAVTIVMTIFGVLFGFSALIAAVGLINNLSLSVIQRRRELGLLRALGFGRGQLRRMILAEATQMSLVAVLFGVLLGTAYGWAGAQSLLGGTIPGFWIAPVFPLPMLLGILLLALLLAAGASLAPSRAATRLSPVRALAVD
ncbi:ABC transporter permease [Mycetocola spongiae]|uniref:ABC transporter permease n=1 Tax=Mycetocola spongiae TaxID=2859226 RepID=UPI001CF2A3EE|nr:ABC transporter permease [Mycetocola spongiae]UCR90448.1 ABC transporter permease [Mycetocola spongiae]